MKKAIFIILLILFSIRMPLYSQSCHGGGGSSHGSSGHDSYNNDHAGHSDHLEIKNIVYILKGYFDAVNALAGDDLEKSKNGLERYLGRMEIAASADNAAYTRPIIKNLEKILKLDDIIKVRKEFKNLSDNTIKLIRKNQYKDNSIKTFYCPMVKKENFSEQNGGYWINNTNMILNPYMGINMQNCGEEIRFHDE